VPQVGAANLGIAQWAIKRPQTVILSEAKNPNEPHPANEVQSFQPWNTMSFALRSSYE